MDTQMIQRKPIVVSEDWKIRSELRALGLTAEIIASVARASAAAKAEALEVDPSSTPGTLAYIKGVRSIRLQLLPHGWRLSRAGNVESTVNDELGIQVCFQNVDVACQEREPQAISGKGAGSRKLIQDGQADLFDRVDPTTTDALGVTPTVWVVCVSADAKKLRAELSCPEAFEGSQFEGFSKRIFVVDEDLDPGPQEDVGKPDEDGGASDYEVRISKK